VKSLLNDIISLFRQWQSHTGIKSFRFGYLANALWDMRSNTRISAITEYTFQFRVGFPFILTYFSVFNSSTTNPNQLHVSKVSGDGFRQILREKITFKVVQFQAVKRF